MQNHFDFRNFAPTDENEAYADLKLDRIMNYAPDGATADAGMEKMGCGYYCTLNIMSYAGPFKVEVLANDVKGAIDRIEQKIMARFSVWHSTRFQKLAA